MIPTRRAAGLLVLTACLYVFAFLGLVTQAPVRAEADRRFPEGSSLRRAEGGAALAAEYLRARGHRVDSLLHQDLSLLPADSVLFVLQPGSVEQEDEQGRERIRPLLTPPEEAFLRGGGRMVLTLRDSIPSIDAHPVPPSMEWTRVHPLLPEGGFVTPVQTLEIGGSWMTQAHALFLWNNKVVAARRQYGEGDLIVIGSPEAFTNDRLASGQTLGWLEALTVGRPVYFDETIHGLFETKGIMDLLADWGQRPALAAALLLLLAWIARERHPFGPPERSRPADYADATDLVGALGLLYSRSVSDEEALIRYAQPTRSSPKGASRPAPSPFSPGEGSAVVWTGVCSPSAAQTPSHQPKRPNDLIARLREINQTQRSSPERARPL